VWCTRDYWEVLWADGSVTWEHSLHFDGELAVEVREQLELEEEEEKEEEKKEEEKASPSKRRKTDSKP
jgi:hypothetical protein